MASWTRIEGSPFPLGVSWIPGEEAFNFALYSKHAHRVTLELYGEQNVTDPVFRYEFNYLRNKTGRIWHCRIPASRADGARYYAYRVDGPAPGTGYAQHHFDPEKVLVDPYAQAVFFPAGFDRGAACRPGDNAGKAPLGLLHPEARDFDWGGDRRVCQESDLVIYEMHVRGFTRDPSSGVSTAKRGTYSGVIEKIPYLVELGITAVELMPVFQFDPQEGNYWGYMPLNFFAPHNGYASGEGPCRQHDEFREMVKALHAAGIEVILDVVFNHTGEGDHRGPAYSFRGIDNSTYYLISGNPANPYRNDAGCGNTLHTANRAVRRLILDSLRHWAEEMHVDGFRFDLASIFSRNSDGSINEDDPAIFGQIGADPDLADVRLIAEPWGGGLYQLGRNFPGTRWSQWNGRFRDTLQRFVRGDPGMVADLMTRLYGSSLDLFPDDRASAYRPFQSVNYITSHDGFTLYDMVAYNHKHNRANGEENRDGHHDSSWNCGCEGDDGAPPEVLELRKRQVKNFCCLLLLANGTPMFRMGDEFLQTQGGNNNPYNQDNETSWLDWTRLEANRDVFRFFQRMIALRKAHPSLARSHFWRDDVEWYGVTPAADTSYNSHSLAFCLDGGSQDDADFYVMINAHWQDMAFGIHQGTAGGWKRVVDTALASPDDIREPGEEVPVESVEYPVRARSVVVLLRP